jgi:hypothetical protein
VTEQASTGRDDELAHLLFDEADALLSAREVQEAFAEAASDLELWERARRNPAVYLERRGISVPDGVQLTMHDAGGEAAGGEEDPQNLAALAHAAHHRSTATLDSGSTFVAIEPSGGVKLLYTCKLVEVCKSVSDPHIMGGKTLWGCRTVCVGTGWVKAVT